MAERPMEHFTVDGVNIFEVTDAKARQDCSDLKEDYTTIINSAYVTDTASGSIASFPDGADNVPVTSLKVNIEPVQDLHGQANPYPAGGGANQFDALTWITLGNNANFYSVANDETITVTANDTAGIGARLFDIEANSTYSVRAIGFTEIKVFNSASSSVISSSSGTFTAPSDGKIAIKCYASSYPTSGKIILIKGSTIPTAWSPYENICPISGHTQAKVTRTGKNLFDFKSDYSDWSDGYLRGDNGLPSGTAAVAPAYERTSPFIEIKGGLTYVFSFANVASATVSNNMCFYDADKNFIGTRITDGAHFYIAGTAPENAAYVRVSARTFNGMSNVQLEVGSTATTYEPYNGQTVTIDLNGTRYGGTLDVLTGVLTVTHAFYQFTGNETINGSVSNAYINTSTFPNPMIAGTWYTDAKTVCDCLPKTNVGKGIRFGADNRTIYFYDLQDIVPAITDKASLDAWIASQKPCITYPIEPVTIQLTANDIKTLLGTNNIWSDAGTVDLEYRADTKLYIEKLTAPTEDDMIADHAISANTFFMIGNTLYRATTAIASGATITVGTNATKLSLSDALNALA